MNQRKLFHLLSPYVTSDGTFYLNDETIRIIAMCSQSELREQIAQEIEGLITHPTLRCKPSCDSERYAYTRVAKIARGLDDTR